MSASQPNWVESNIALGPPGGYPTDTLFVNQTDELYTAVYPSYVVVTSAATGGVVARLDLGQDVAQLAYDNFTHEVLASGPSSIDLFAIDVSDNQLAGAFPLANPERAMSFDSANGRLLLLVQQINNEGNGTYWVGGTILELDGTDPGYPLITTLQNIVDFGMFPDWFDGSMTIDTVRQVVYATGAAGFSGYAGIQWFELASPTVGGTEYGGGGGVSVFDPQTDTVYVVGGAPLYCPCTELDEISVISGTTHNVTGVITPNNEAWVVSMTLDPTTQRLYALDSGGMVYAIATGNNTVVAQYPLTTTCGAGISVDTHTGGVYVPDWCGNELQILSPESGQLSQVVVGGGGPAGIAYDSRTADVVVANSLANNATIVSTETQSVVATVNDIPEAAAAVYDPSTSAVYVVGEEGIVAVLNDQNWTVTDEFSLPMPNVSQGEGEVAAVYDPVTSQVYVSMCNLNTSASSVYVISDSTHAIVRTIAVSSSLGYGVDALTFDPLNSAVWLGTANGYIGWINSPAFTLTNAPATNYSRAVYSLAFDGDVDAVYAGVENFSYPTPMGELIGMNATVGWPTSFSQVGRAPYAIAWAPHTHDVVAANYYDSNVSILNDSTNLVTATLPVGVGPDALAYEPRTGAVYVANEWSDNLSVLFPAPFQVTFEEEGLPAGTSWSVTMDGVERSSNSSSIAFSEPNGTFTFVLGPVPGYAPVIDSGSVTVLGTNPTPTWVVFESTAGSPLPWWAYVLVGVPTSLIVFSVLVVAYRQGRRPRSGPPPPL